jgi:hypothetical protein
MHKQDGKKKQDEGNISPREAVFLKAFRMAMDNQ